MKDANVGVGYKMLQKLIGKRYFEWLDNVGYKYCGSLKKYSRIQTTVENVWQNIITIP